MAVDARLVTLCSYYRDAELRDAFGFSLADAAAS